MAVAACSSGGGGDGGGGSGGGGGGGGGGTAVPQIRFAFAGNSDGTVSIFGVDPNPGGLRHIGYLKINGFPVQDIVVHSNNQYAYVLTSDGTLTAFSFDSQSGALTLVNSVAVGGNPSDILLDADGRFLYATSRTARTVSTYAIASANGALSLAGAQPTGTEPVKIALAPSGQFAYVANRSAQTVSIYARDTTTGVLTLSATTPSLGDSPTAIIVNKAGTFAYVTYASSTNNVEVFSLATPGALTFVQTVSAGDTPLDIQLDNNNAFAYVANVNSDSVSVFSINASDGKLTSFQTMATGDDPRALRLDIDNKYLYVATFGSSEVSAYTVAAATGMLTLIDHFRARNGLNAIAISSSTTAFSTLARHAFAPDGDVHGYSVDATTGALSSPTTKTAGTDPLQVALTPDNRFAYVLNLTSSSISVFQFNAASGTLGTTVQTASPPSTWATDVLLYRILVDPSGRFLYLLDGRNINDLSGRIAVYTIDQTNGRLTFASEVSTGRNPENMVIHPAGRYLYSIDSFGDTITLFEVGGSNGALTIKQTFFPGLTGSGFGRPITLAFHPNGRYAYVTLDDDKQLVRYFIDPSNGFLTASQAVTITTAQITTDPSPRYIAVDPSGLYAYVSHQGGDVSTWNIDPSSFALSFASTVAVQNLPTWIALDPNGQFAYTVVTGGIARLTIGSGGALSFQETTTTGTGGSFFRTATVVSVIQ
jgi:6-phosphogluconolactonase (cycloisomerase 2 family)